VFTDLISSLIHLAAAIAFLVAAPRLLVRLSTDAQGRLRPDASIRRLTAGFYVFGVVFILVFSGLYHLSEQAYGNSAVTESFRQLDHIGIWVVIAATLSTLYILTLRGNWRWVPLAITLTGAAGGIYTKLFYFGSLTLMQSFSLYTAVIMVGGVSLVQIARLHGTAFVGDLIRCWIAMTIAAVFFVFQPPDLIAGWFGFHEVWHVGVVVGTCYHWRFVFNAAHVEALPAPALSPVLADTLADGAQDPLGAGSAA
jgi:hemolysin III